MPDDNPCPLSSFSPDAIEARTRINTWALRSEPLFRIALRMRWLEKLHERRGKANQKPPTSLPKK